MKFSAMKSSTNVTTMIVLLVFITFVSGLTANASGILIIEKRVPYLPDNPSPPVLPIPPFPPQEMPPIANSDPSVLPVKSLSYQVEVKGDIARVEIDQVFLNSTDRRIEGTFMYPLGSHSSLSSLNMFIGEKEVEAELLDSGEAEKIYEEIVRREKDPALLEWAGNGAYKVRIFPIEARSEVRVKLAYSQPIRRTGRIISFDCPISAALASGESVDSVSLGMKLNYIDGIETVYSPTHTLHVKRSSREEVKLSWEAVDYSEHKDLIVHATLSEGLLGMNFLTHANSDEDGYFLAMLAPSFQDPAVKPRAKDVVLVIDTSGSMAGERLKGAQEALEHILNSLRPEDKFAIVEFATEGRQWKNSMSPVTEAHISDAVSFVRSLKARGGTNISHAIQEAFSYERSERPFMVVLVSDGAPTIGETNTSEIVKKAMETREEARLFALGIGDQINTHLLDKLVQKCRGASEYAVNSEDVEAMVSEFYHSIDSPVLTDVELQPVGFRIDDLHPKPLPDIFLGSGIILTGRYSRGGHRMVRLIGNTDSGEIQLEFEGDFPADNKDNDWLPRIWASRQIAYLLDEIRLNGENRELKEEIVRLAKKHGIVTPYTSFLVVEEDQRLPALSREGVFRNYAHKATEERFAMSDLAAPTGSSGLGAAISINRMKRETKIGKAGIGQIRVLGDRVFYLRGNRWIQSGISSLNGETVVFGSEKYFDLLRNNPELGKILSLGSRIIFSHGKIIYEIMESIDETNSVKGK